MINPVPQEQASSYSPMNEQARLQDLYSYHILDTLPEQELDELAEVASAICGTPISLISFVDKDRQWFKAKKGIEVPETPRSYSFCQHTLHNPKEVLVVNNPLQDERFKDNPLVIGKPNIRFYAGAPLETTAGHVLGTLCIIDNRPRTINESQKKALQLLAKKAMDYLEMRQLLSQQGDAIALSASRLKMLTDQAPGVLFQLEKNPEGELSFPFLSRGLTALYPGLNINEFKNNPEKGLEIIHPEDLPYFKDSLQESFTKLTNWNIEYRIFDEKGNTHWHWANARPEKKEDGSVVLYGTFQDITHRKEYIDTLEQMLFDISHTMRRPVATMMSITNAIENSQIDGISLMSYVEHIKRVSLEMDAFIKSLNECYLKKMAKFDRHIE